MAKDRRRKILRAAEGLMGARRFHEVTMDDVAQAAGVGKGTLYRYFENKDALFAQLAEFGFEELCGKIRSVPVGTGAFADDLTKVCGAISDFFTRRLALMRVMNEAEDRDACRRRRLPGESEDWRCRLHGELVTWLKSGVAGGELRNDLPLDDMAFLLLNMIRGRTRYLRRNPEGLALESLIEVFLDGCRPGRDA